MGKIEDARKAVTLDAKRPGDLVYILGETYDELGGSEWYAMHGFIGNQVPKVNAEKAKTLYDALSRAINAGLVASCHDCSDGGAGIAIAETAFAGGLGMLIHLALFPSPGIDRNDTLLFSESQSRFIVTISPVSKKAFEAVMMGITLAQVGEVLAEEILKIDGLGGNRIVEGDINELKAAWQRPLDF